MSVGIQTVTTSFHTNQLDARIFAERIEHPYSIAPTSNACHNGIRKLSSLFHHLGFRLIADD
jgi:hypothetical protein